MCSCRSRLWRSACLPLRDVLLSHVPGWVQHRLLRLRGVALSLAAAAALPAAPAAASPAAALPAAGAATAAATALPAAAAVAAAAAPIPAAVAAIAAAATATALPAAVARPAAALATAAALAAAIRAAAPLPSVAIGRLREQRFLSCRGLVVARLRHRHAHHHGWSALLNGAHSAAGHHLHSDHGRLVRRWLDWCRVVGPRLDW